MCLSTSNSLLLVLQDAPKRSRDLVVSQKKKKKEKRHFFSHPPSLFPGNFCNCNRMAFGLLRNSRFNFHYYTHREAASIQRSARKWRCDLSRFLARKITKGIHSCKPASLNRPIGCPKTLLFFFFFSFLFSFLFFLSTNSRSSDQPPPPKKKKKKKTT